jgi:hypothetical protein
VFDPTYTMLVSTFIRLSAATKFHQIQFSSYDSIFDDAL